MITLDDLERLRRCFRTELARSPLNVEAARMMELAFERSLTAACQEAGEDHYFRALEQGALIKTSYIPPPRWSNRGAA